MSPPAETSWSSSLPGPETREWLLQPNQQSPQVRGRSRSSGALSGLYDSRDNPGSGIGFPSLGRELARLAPNDKDPHDYYAEIGVPRDATTAEIRSAVRKLYFKHHPDTGTHPDTKKLTRVQNIAKVLLDPVTRERYNRTPEGMRLMDAVYEQELIDDGVLSALQPDEFEAVMTPRSATPSYGYAGTPGRPRMASVRYDFFAIDHRAGDWMKANQWYHHLLAVGGDTTYRQVLKVMLVDGHPGWNPMASMMLIPRGIDPSDFWARWLFEQAGFIAKDPVALSP